MRLNKGKTIEKVNNKRWFNKKWWKTKFVKYHWIWYSENIKKN